MNIRGILLVAMLLGARGTLAQPASSPLSEMTVVGIYASRPGDTSVYCLLGGSACLERKDAGTADHAIAQWLKAHPGASVIPVSSATDTTPTSTKPGSPAKVREVYVWITDGDDVLNVALVRRGYYAARSMIDMVESERQQDERVKKMAAEDHSGGVVADVMAKLRDSIPKEDRPRRWVSDSDYEARMKEIKSAEHAAQLAKRGIWSADVHRRDGDISRRSKDSFPVRDLYVHGIDAHRMEDAEVYCLIGGHFCLTMLGPMVHEDQVAFISNWLSQHPNAIATPISNESVKVMRDEPPIHSTYIWIADGKESLNLALVRNGYYRAQALTDMVEARQQLEDSMKAPALSEARAMLAKEREEAAPQRLVTDQEYQSNMLQANAAEHDAEKAQVGIWSPSEIVHWKPPSDAAMIDVYAKHPDWFQQVSALARDDGRLREVIRSPESIARARSNGVPQEELDAYVCLLEKLGVNETISDVVGLGQLSLVKADIIFGPFGNGIIKGYLYATATPQPIVNDLENWPPELANVTTAYRSLGNDWYLFELFH